MQNLKLDNGLNKDSSKWTFGLKTGRKLNHANQKKVFTIFGFLTACQNIQKHLRQNDLLVIRIQRSFWR